MKKTIILLITLWMSVVSFGQTTLDLPGIGSSTVGYANDNITKVVLVSAQLPSALQNKGDTYWITIEGIAILARNVLNSNDLTVLELEMTWYGEVANFSSSDLTYLNPNDVNVIFDEYGNELNRPLYNFVFDGNDVLIGGRMFGEYSTIIGGGVYDTGEAVKAVVYEKMISTGITFITWKRVTDSIIWELGGELPVADFTANQTNITVGETVQFTDLSTNAPTSWEWTFEGGIPGTSTEQNPAVTYNTAGVYDVTLVVTNSDGSDTETKNGYIIVSDGSGTLVADFNWYPVNPHVGETVQFVNHSLGNPTSKIWGFEGGDPFSATGDTVYVVYDVAESYSVTLFISDNQGNMADTTKTITITEILPVPIPGFTADKFVITQGDSIHFQDTSLYATSHFWMFEGVNSGNSTEQNPVVTYDEIGTHDVLLIVSNTTGSASILKQGYITVNPVISDTVTFTVHMESSNRIDSTLAVDINTISLQFEVKDSLGEPVSLDSVDVNLANRHAETSNSYPGFYESTIVVQSDDPSGPVSFQIYWKKGAKEGLVEMTTDGSFVIIDHTPATISDLTFVTLYVDNNEKRHSATLESEITLQIAIPTGKDVPLDSIKIMDAPIIRIVVYESLIDPSVTIIEVTILVTEEYFEKPFWFQFPLTGEDINTGYITGTSDGSAIEWIPFKWGFQVRPNPITIGQYFTLEYDVPDNCHTIIFELYDDIGRLIYQEIENNTGAEFHSRKMRIEQALSPGTYFLRIIALKYDGQPYVACQKILVQR